MGAVLEDLLSIHTASPQSRQQPEKYTRDQGERQRKRENAEIHAGLIDPRKIVRSQ